jgi:hypothetical protein
MDRRGTLNLPRAMKMIPSSLCVVVLACGVLAQSGGDFAIVSSTIDNGGGLSAGGDYSLQGTIGQSDPGHVAGGDFLITGGFWQGIVVPVPDAPPLTMQPIPGPRFVLQWPQTSETWHLQQSTDLQQWIAVETPPEANGDTWTVTITPAAPRLFFRLSHTP